MEESPSSKTSTQLSGAFWRRSDLVAPAGVFLLALALRLFALCLKDYLSRDSQLYIDAADLLLKDGWNAIYANPDFSSPPLMILIMALGKLLCGSSMAAGLVLNMLCGSLLPVGLYFMAYAMTGGRRYALFAGVLGSCEPSLISLSANILRDMPYLCLLAWGGVAGIHVVKEGRPLQWLALIVLASLGLFMRKEGVEMVVFIYLCIALRFLFAKRGLLERFISSLKELFLSTSLLLCFISPAYLLIPSYAEVQLKTFMTFIKMFLP